MTDKFGQEIISCRLCDGPTSMLGTKLCDRCWELERRIQSNPELALKILNTIEKANVIKI